MDKQICIEKECGKEFMISKEEKEFFERKGFPLPKRCKECRRKRREAKARGEFV